jgi:hypothetical protein
MKAEEQTPRSMKKPAVNRIFDQTEYGQAREEAEYGRGPVPVVSSSVIRKQKRTREVSHVRVPIVDMALRHDLRDTTYHTTQLSESFD